MDNEKKDTYYVSFGTGAETGFVSKKSLEETIKEAEKGMSYTQRDVSIYKVKEDFDSKNPDIDFLMASPILTSMWIDYMHTGAFDLKPLVDFGKYGYYTEWCDENGLARAISTETINNIQGGITMSEAVNGKKGFEGNGYDQSRIGRYYYDGNANAFYEGIKGGTLPAVSITGAEMLPYDMISMKPNAVRYYTNGKMFTGVNQLVAQKFAHEMGFQPDQNGNINVVTYRQAGEKNLMKGQKHFPVASYDKEKNQVNYYNLYPESALIDKTKVEVKSPYDTKKIHREHREIQIEAMDENISIAEYFGKYEAATQLGATFVTTKAAIKSVQEKAEKEIAPHIKTGLTGKVYALSAEMSSVSKEEMQKVFQSMKPKAREMTMQRDQSISMN